MHLDLDADEQALQQGIRELLDARFDLDRVRAAADTAGVDRAGISELAESGVFALRLAEGEGGLDLGFTHAAVVFEQLGVAATPGPLIAQHLAAGLVDGAAEGTTVVGAVDRDRCRGVVANLPGLDVLLVVDDAGIWQLDPSTLTGVGAERPLDPATPVWHVADLPQGTQIAAADAAAEWRDRHDVLRAALLVGLSERATTMAVKYAKEREQFGTVIGAFQAVKHLCADMLARTEIARAQLYSAAVHLDDASLPGRGREIASAVLRAGDAAVENGKSAIQVHGGMGFTWEVDVHLLHKRAHVLLADGRTTHELQDLLAAALVS